MYASLVNKELRIRGITGLLKAMCFNQDMRLVTAFAVSAQEFRRQHLPLTRVIIASVSKVTKLNGTLVGIQKY